MTVKKLVPDDFPLFTICPYLPLKPWGISQLDGLDLRSTDNLEVLKKIISKQDESLTSEKVRMLYEDIFLLPKDIIHDVVVEYSISKKESIIETGREAPVSPVLGKEHNQL